MVIILNGSNLVNYSLPFSVSKILRQWFQKCFQLQKTTSNSSTKKIKSLISLMFSEWLLDKSFSVFSVELINQCYLIKKEIIWDLNYKTLLANSMKMPDLEYCNSSLEIVSKSQESLKKIEKYWVTLET
jgi:hypothetical protein